MEISKYPSLSKLVKVFLTVFHGPVVESTFNLMDTIVTDSRTSMGVDSLDAVQTVKFDLLSTNSATFDKYASINPINETLEKNLLHNLRTSWTSYKDDLKNKQDIEKGKSVIQLVLAKQL